MNFVNSRIKPQEGYPGVPGGYRELYQAPIEIKQIPLGGQNPTAGLQRKPTKLSNLGRDLMHGTNHGTGGNSSMTNQAIKGHLIQNQKRSMIPGEDEDEYIKEQMRKAT